MLVTYLHTQLEEIDNNESLTLFKSQGSLVGLIMVQFIVHNAKFIF
jgi:hypothetical protein